MIADKVGLSRHLRFGWHPSRGIRSGARRSSVRGCGKVQHDPSRALAEDSKIALVLLKRDCDHVAGVDRSLAHLSADGVDDVRLEDLQDAGEIAIAFQTLIENELLRRVFDL